LPHFLLVQIAASEQSRGNCAWEKFKPFVGRGSSALSVYRQYLSIDRYSCTYLRSSRETLTKDTVPVDVVAVFWKVLDPEKAALNVADYQALSTGRTNALRDVIGKLCSPICWKAETNKFAITKDHR